MEENVVDKHEFIEGAIYLMAGGTPNHNAITVNIATELNLGLRGRDCTTYSSDMRLSTDGKTYYTYPDVSVVCGKPEFVVGRNDTITNPLVVVEVFSPSNENYDRGKKAEYYCRITSLMSYILVDQSRIYVEHFRRVEGGNWFLETFTEIEQIIKIPALNLEIPLLNIYDKIIFES